MTNADLLLRLFLQLAVILLACRVVGIVGKRLGQAQVISEMVAGILLGPSLVGFLLPDIQHWLFPQKITIAGVVMPHPSMTVLYMISQIGLTLYMFLVGLEFDAHLIRNRALHAGVVSGGGMVLPFLLGGALAFLLYGHGNMFGSGISPWIAALFLGASMCITAFPVLARILQEHRITQTRLGTLVLTAASIDDVSAWCLLATILAVSQHAGFIAVTAVGGGAFYTLGMLTLGRRGLRFLGPLAESKGLVTKEMLSLVLLVVLICAWFTTQIGIHQVFGAFVAGVAMPRGRFADEMRRRLEGVTLGLLLPVFFVYSGLNTQVSLVNSSWLWLIAGVILLVALVGKGVTCAVGAHLVGLGWRESSTVGVLMNARGLIELILLNIGLDAGILTPTLFTILVLMAVITTLITSPLFRWLTGWVNAEGEQAIPKVAANDATSADHLVAAYAE